MQSSRWYTTMVLVGAGILAGANPAPAQVTQATDRGDISGVTVDWSGLGPSSTQVTSPTTVTPAGGPAFTVGNVDGTAMERRDQNAGWNGNFLPGESLLWTRGSRDGMEFVFSQYLTGFGTSIQRVATGDFTATIQIFHDAVLLGSFSQAGTSTGMGDGSAIFLGAISGSAATSFNRVVLTTTGAGPFDDFAINGPVIAAASPNTVTPEPTSMVLLGSGLAGLCALRRRRRGKDELV